MAGDEHCEASRVTRAASMYPLGARFVRTSLRSTPATLTPLRTSLATPSLVDGLGRPSYGYGQAPIMRMLMALQPMCLPALPFNRQ